jgi:3'-5' exoribonuclease
LKVFISDLIENEEVVSFFLIVDAPQVRKSKKGSDYACIELLDKSGKIDARLWEIPAGLDVNSLKKVIVKVKGQVSSWNDQLQISISQIRIVNGGDDVDMADFFERSARDPEEMWSELLHVVDMNVVDEKVLTLIRRVLLGNKENFCKAPAAKSVHHNYLGGLLEHTLSMCRTVTIISEKYQLNVDLMVAACVLHDIGKVHELSYEMGTSYTVEGTLIGHIPIGLLLTSKAIEEIDGFPASLRMALLHLVASHHGRLE